MRVQINGEAREVSEALNLSELVSELSLAPERVAIELNKQVVRRNQWPETILADGDRIEIVRFVGGGNCSRQKAVSRRLKTVVKVSVSVLSGVQLQHNLNKKEQRFHVYRSTRID